MKKFLVAFTMLTAAAMASFAGDAAAFNDIGFSKDGRIYIFGQYGKTDKKYQPYAEIYTIDVERNEYVSGEVYKNLEPMSSRSGKQIYEDLFARHYLDIKRYDCKTADAENVLYVCEDINKKGTDEIRFRNFDGNESGSVYKVQLVPTFYGKGIESRSSFYINLDIEDESGNLVKKYKIGSPDIKRKGVTGYKIVRIFRDSSKKGLVFVVEKTVEDSTGTSIRYMVETIRM